MGFVLFVGFYSLPARSENGRHKSSFLKLFRDSIGCTKTMTLDFFEQFRRNLEQFPDQVALQSISEKGRESFTYRRVGDEIARVGSFLQKSGVRPGDSVGILMENHPRWGIAFLAAQSAGAVVVPFDIMHPPETLARLAQHSECSFLISSEQCLEKLAAVQSRLPASLPALVASRPGSCSHPTWDTVLEQESPASLPLVRRDLDEPLVVIYTSGTTGDPKGVVLTQRAVYRNVVELLQIIKAGHEDHILSVLPLYHVLALMTNFIIPLFLGARVTYLDVLEAQRILAAFSEEGITIFVCVPQFYYLVHRRIFQEVERQGFLKRFLFRRLLTVSRFCNQYLGFNPGRLFFPPVHQRFGKRFRLFGVGGARFDPEIATAFRDLGFSVIQAYGMTETAALVTVTPPGEGVGSVGRPLPHLEVRIEDADENGVGEVVFRGETLMMGYLKNLEATQETLRDGWLYSGDLGYLDRGGFLYITGRKKDVIVPSSGKNIYPEEVEHFYQTHCPYIREVCVLGVASGSGSGDEDLHAVVVPDFDRMRADQVTNAHDAIRYYVENVSHQIPSYKRIHSFQIRTEPLPRTTTRKIKRFEVQKELHEKPAEKAPSEVPQYTPENSLEATVLDFIRQVKKSAAVHPDQNLELDLGFDSLERVELLSNLQEAFGIQVPDEEAAEILTVRELVSAVEKRVSPEEAAEVRAGIHESASWSELLSSPLSEEDRRSAEAILVRRPLFSLVLLVAARLGYVLARILFRLRFQGREQLPRRGPYLICPNHLSYLDVLLLVCGLPYHVLRSLFFLGFSELFKSRFALFVTRLLRNIPVDASRHLRQALRLAAEGLRKEFILCVFPEGERSIDGRLKPFRKGPSILAVELGLPVVPVGITGTYEAWPRGVNRIRLHPVGIRFGPPLEPEPGEGYDAFNERLYEAVKALVQEE